jgi:hypothetical protein
MRYTATERELLSIVETFKEFRTILMGQQLIVHTDHENLTYKHFNTDSVMRWRLFIEESSPDLRYIKGELNIVADALPRLGILNAPLDEAHFTEELRSACYALDEEEMPQDSSPLSYQLIGKIQSKDKDILAELKKTKSRYVIKPFEGGGTTRNLICYGDKIVVPKKLQPRGVQCYHDYLGHPGINRTAETIGQHLWWPQMRNQITNSVLICGTCQ